MDLSRLVIGYMEGAAEEEEELKTKRIPKHSEACGNTYMVACLTFYNRKVCFLGDANGRCKL